MDVASEKGWQSFASWAGRTTGGFRRENLDGYWKRSKHTKGDSVLIFKSRDDRLSKAITSPTTTPPKRQPSTELSKNFHKPIEQPKHTKASLRSTLLNQGVRRGTALELIDRGLALTQLKLMLQDVHTKSLLYILKDSSSSSSTNPYPPFQTPSTATKTPQRGFKSIIPHSDTPLSMDEGRAPVRYGTRNGYGRKVRYEERGERIGLNSLSIGRACPRGERGRERE